MKAQLTKLPSFPGEEFHDVEDAETYKKMMARDERRFRVADQDGDSMATREELTAFLHPEEFPHMRDIVVAVSESQPPGAYFGGSGHLVLPHLPQGTQATSTDPWRATFFIPAPTPLCHSRWKDLYLLLPCLTSHRLL